MTMVTTASNETLARALERQQLLPADVLRGLVASAVQQQKWLGEAAAETGALSYEEIARAISLDAKIPLANLRNISPNLIALSKFPEEQCRRFSMLPLSMEAGMLSVVMGDPFDEDAKRIARERGGELVVHVAPMDEVHATITNWYLRLSPETLVRPAAPISPETLPIITPNQKDESDTVILEDLLRMMAENKSSDLHLAVGSPPLMRVHGELTPMPFPVLKPTTLQPLVYSILTDIQITAFERHWELDFSYSLPGVSRFRVNVHKQRGSVGAVFRSIPSETPTLDKLRMPPIVRELTLRPRGLVLVTGPTGSGKSTTLAAMIDEINRTMRTHIVTVEDPIEFLHNNKMSVITQREVGSDTESFSIALRHVLRQDPDVILIGEMRDLETISAALTAAETGHLVFATLHTTSAAQSIDRIVDVFPAHQQDQVRTQLANVLEGILTQTLLQCIDGKGRVCAQEILIGTAAIRTLIRDNKVHQMPSIMQASGKYGMQTLDQCLRQLVFEKKVTIDEAIAKSSNPEDFKALLAMQ
ncbi:MAG: PilT/PilU family type 4a pilus ATPase [Armatimonadota bacterium]